MSYNDAVMYASLMVGLQGVTATMMSHYLNVGFCNSMKVRVAITNLIYKKSLRLSQTALHDTSPGKLVNLLSNDVNQFDLVSLRVNSLWISPIFMVIAVYFLWQEIQWGAILGFCVILAVMPLQSKYVQLMRLLRASLTTFHHLS